MSWLDLSKPAATVLKVTAEALSSLRRQTFTFGGTFADSTNTTGQLISTNSNFAFISLRVSVFSSKETSTLDTHISGFRHFRNKPYFQTSLLKYSCSRTALILIIFCLRVLIQFHCNGRIKWTNITH